MNFKKSLSTIQDKNTRDLDNSKDYPTFTDLINKKRVPKDNSNTVHRRRDLYSLG